MPRPRSRPNKLRTALLVTASIVFVAVVAAVLVSMAGSGTKHHAGAKHLTVKPGAKIPPFKLALGPVSVQDVGPPATVSTAVRAKLLRATQMYFNDAVRAPLTSGRVNNAYETLFDAGVKGPASGSDRAALTESGTGIIHAPLHLTASSVRIDGLGDQTGKLAFVATTFSSQINANTPVGELTIKRHTELTFANEFGRWLITAYRIVVRRSIGHSTTTTTVHSGTTT